MLQPFHAFFDILLKFRVHLSVHFIYLLNGSDPVCTPVIFRQGHNDQEDFFFIVIWLIKKSWVLVFQKSKLCLRNNILLVIRGVIKSLAHDCYQHVKHSDVDEESGHHKEYGH